MKKKINELIISLESLYQLYTFKKQFNEKK